MQPRRIYDYLVLARQRIFEQARAMNPEQYAREFPIGPGTLGRMLTHIMISEWYYVQRMLGRDVPPYQAWTIRWEEPPPFAALEAAWIKQADETRATIDGIDSRGVWNETIEYRVTADYSRTFVVTTTAADLFIQLMLHEAHHRAQAMNILRHLDVAAEDLDFNAMMFDRREV